MTTTAPDIAIVICTFDPEEAIFVRLMDAVAALDLQGLRAEGMLVDNNSRRPLTELESVARFLERCPWMRLEREERQGHAFARLHGVRTTSAPVLIFFDDDNEPAVHYAKAALECFRGFEEVGAWGPGRVKVDFVKAPPGWFAAEYRDYFQEAHLECSEYGPVTPDWRAFYPYGTGLAVRRDVADSYADGLETGRLTAAGRIGTALASCDDLQLVWESGRLGLWAGRSTTLGLTHVISARRSTDRYLSRQAFAASAAFTPALVESFPECLASIRASMRSSADVAVGLGRVVTEHALRFRWRLLRVRVAEYLGRHVGILRAARRPPFPWLTALAEMLRLTP